MSFKGNSSNFLGGIGKLSVILEISFLYDGEGIVYLYFIYYASI